MIDKVTQKTIDFCKANNIPHEEFNGGVAIDLDKLTKEDIYKLVEYSNSLKEEAPN